MKRAKKIRAIVTIVLILTNIIEVPVHAQSRENAERQLTESNIEACIVTTALDWAAMIEPGIDFVIGDITYIINEAGKVMYAVSYFSERTPYGYAVISDTQGDMVVQEGQLVKGKEGLRVTIIDEIDKSGVVIEDNALVSKAIVQIAPLQYGAVVSEKEIESECICDNYGNLFEIEEVDTLQSALEDEGVVEELLYGSKQYGSVDSIYIKSSNWVTSKYQVQEKITLLKYQYRTWLFSERDIEKLTGKYACSVQALTQIAYMEKLCTHYDDSIKATYNKLWNYTKTRETAESKKNTASSKIVYGTGTIKNAANGFVRLAKEMGYKNTEFKGIEINPSVAWIKNKLEYNRPILMGYGINVNGKRSGHAISILGYERATKVSSGKKYNYLKVYDGWNNTPAYMNYTTVDMMDCSATYFWVK